MSKSKVLILLPDGIGLRNFAFTRFSDIAKSENLNLIYWNATPFDLMAIGLSEKRLDNIRLHPLSDFYKTTRKHVELNSFKRGFNDPVYDTYKFPLPKGTLKRQVKALITKALITVNNSTGGLKRVRNKIKTYERSTDYYQDCIKTIRHEKPKAVFCTNQRSSTAIAPILAAQDLNIPTITFIFSWDNLPKATMVVETDFYFVWSDYMKHELLIYYPYIKEDQVVVTGTPQFENHKTNADSLDEKETFFKEYNLDLDKKYICFSGDDITTSPDDQDYLQDVAKAVTSLNEKGENLGIVFRRCPVDFSNRYDAVLKTYKDLIVPIAPKWEKISSLWNTILPTREDMKLQSQTIKYTEMVINLGSSMVFDYAVYNKPCAFINYDVPNRRLKNWSVKKIYNYVHFRSMPNDKSVVWLNSPDDISGKIEKALNKNNASEAQEWFKIINSHPIENASVTIVNELKKIIK